MTEEKRTPQEWTKIILRRLTYLLGPILIYCVFLLFLWGVYPPETLFSGPSQEYLVLLGLFFAYLVPPLGKESIIPIAIGVGYPAWVVIAGVVLMDMVTAMFIALNFDLLLKVPLLGRLLKWLMNGATNIRQKKPWIEKLSYVGLLIFMYVPLQGSGAINTTILGRLFALEPKIVYGIVTIGSILSSLTVAFGFTMILDLWYVNPFYAIFAIFGVIVFIILIYLLWKKYTTKLNQKET